MYDIGSLLSHFFQERQMQEATKSDKMSIMTKNQRMEVINL
jgi:hypothetical protein